MNVNFSEGLASLLHKVNSQSNRQYEEFDFTYFLFEKNLFAKWPPNHHKLKYTYNGGNKSYTKLITALTLIINLNS